LSESHPERIKKHVAENDFPQVRIIMSAASPIEISLGQPQKPPIMSMRHITKRFPGVLALNDVSFDVYEGRVHCLVGENGAGKSTLMKIMCGVYTHFDGELRIDEHPVRFSSTRDSQNAGIAIIHQEMTLVSELKIYENIFMGREYQNRIGIINRARMKEDTTALLAELGLDINPNRLAGSLRVGQQQLVEIAKALSLDARILIMDEPTSALSDTEVDYLFEVIYRLAAQGVAIVYISHRLDEIGRIGDHITVLRDGEVVGSASTSQMDRSEMIRLMVGRELKAMYPKETISLGRPVLKIEGMSIKTGGATILKDVSLEVHEGEIVGIAGLMGSRRTELLEAIFGVYPESSYSGRLNLDGQDGFPKSPKDAISKGLGLVAEDRKQQSLILEQSVVHNMTLPVLSTFIRRFFLLHKGAEKKAANGIVDELSIRTPDLETMINNLSGGNQQKVVFGKYLIREMKCFLLDEPTRGVDVGAKAEIYQLVGGLAKAGKAFLVVSSELQELLAICDRIYVLCDGRITDHLPRDAFDQERIMDAATRFHKTS
jgi:ABC-type sugar transport system ATPase subunit